MLKQVLSLTVGSSLGKLTGIGREILFAALYGTSGIADGYRAALSVTISSIHLFTSEVFNSFFIPNYKKYRSEGKAESWILLNSVGGIILLISLGLTLLLHFGASPVIHLLVPGFDSDRLEQAIYMLRVMAWGIPFYVLSAITVNLEAASGRFWLAALRPLAQNVGVIVAILVGYFSGHPLWVAWGFTGTYVLFSTLGVGWIVCRGMLEAGWYRHWGPLVTVWRNLWPTLSPLLIFTVFLQGNILLEKLLASLVGPGAVAAVDYARIIPETVHVLLVMPLGFVSLSASVELTDEETLQRCDKLSAAILMIALPASCFIFFSAADIVELIYARGAFNQESVYLTTRALQGMSVGLWAVGIGYVIQKIFNARLRNDYVLRFGLVAVGVNVFFNLMTYRTLGVLGIGLGFSFGAMAMAFLYVRALGRMRLTFSVAKVCFLCVVPYALLVGLFWEAGSETAMVRVVSHLSLAMVYWLTVYGIFPSSRRFCLFYLRRLWQ